MNIRRMSKVCVVAVAVWVTQNVVKAQPFDVGTAFTYQGKLDFGGVAVNDICDFAFSLWDDPSLGSQKGSTQAANSVTVDDGLFTVPIDFGAGAINGEARWLKIEVRCPAGAGAFTPLSPRQELTPTPYSIRAGTAAGIASQRMSSTVTLNISNMVDVETLEITTPAGGYVVVEGKCFIQFSGTTAPSYAFVQIDTVAGGGTIIPYYTIAGLGGYENSAFNNDFPVYVTRVFQVSAGTHTYRLEARKSSTAGTAIAWFAILTATYYPTSYGATLPAVASSMADLPEPAIDGVHEMSSGEEFMDVQMDQPDLVALVQDQEQQIQELHQQNQEIHQRLAHLEQIINDRLDTDVYEGGVR